MRSGMTGIFEPSIFRGQPYWDDLRIPLVQARPGNSTPAFAKCKDDGSGSVGVYTYQFSASAAQDLQFITQIPHGWQPGSLIRPHIHWAPSSANVGNVVWQFEYTIAGPGAVFPAVTIIDPITVAAGGSGVHLINGFTPITIDPTKLSHILVCSISRLGDAGIDTYPDIAHGLEFDFHILLDTPGSRGEYTK